MPMKYDVISADCHIDLIWLPPDLFTANAPADLKDRMPHVIEGRKGMQWVANNGATFGLMNGMLRIYNEGLAGFCRMHPDRYAGLASIPSHDIGAAVAEVKRVADAGIL